MWDWSQWAWLGIWALYVPLAAVLWHWIAYEIPFIAFGFVAAVIGAAAFTSLVWPHAILLVAVLFMRRQIDRA
ncbi:hypothetical protein RDV64_22800 (plasmid) [Acuticoccus sp. MNP-M23]|uniref:hypothetical protein n=1 Tax=Acuticoccus sp. MNP-M23 TaxID=3072793 RepID=UPI0028150996|nr:hypothetical protein [Acuticoccus sp. MNP-M23]WMS45219.1 hypothetical protein RDV64_22800 [Acuticoccus sp. MNP-M23]